MSLTDSQWDATKAYALQVRASTRESLDTMTEADLDRRVQLFGSERSVSDAFAIFGLFHFVEHLGEMADLKGMLGKKGLPL